MLGNTIGTLFLSLLTLTGYAGEFVLPPNDGFVTDPGDVIPFAEEELLEQEMAQEWERTGVAFVAVILPTLAERDIVHLAWEIRTKWGIEKSGSGILLLIAREEGKTLIAPGKNHADLLTDHILQEIVEREVLPSLRKGKFAIALQQGTNAVRKHLNGEYAEQRSQGGKFSSYTSYRTMVLFLVLLAVYVGIHVRRKRKR